MFRARLPLWLIAPLLWFLGASSAARAQGNRLFPSKVPQNSDALRNPIPRRTPPPARPDTVDLPYHMLWGDSMNRLAALFAGSGATIANKKTEKGIETWTVQGLLAADLQTSLFRFSNGQLAALEFDYANPDWDTDKYNDKMGQFRRLLEAKCEAPGEMISRQTDQPPAENGIKQSLMGYQWRRGDTLVQLFYFSAEDPDKKLTFRNISLHYYYQDPTPPAPADVALPESGGNSDPNAGTLFGGKAATGTGAASPAASVEPTPAPTPVPTPAWPWEIAPDVPMATPVPPPTRGNKGKRPVVPTESDPLPE